MIKCAFGIIIGIVVYRLYSQGYSVKVGLTRPAVPQSSGADTVVPLGQNVPITEAAWHQYAAPYLKSLTDVDSMTPTGVIK